MQNVFSNLGIKIHYLNLNNSVKIQNLTFCFSLSHYRKVEAVVDGDADDDDHIDKTGPTVRVGPAHHGIMAEDDLVSVKRKVLQHVDAFKGGRPISLLHPGTVVIPYDEMFRSFQFLKIGRDVLSVSE